MKHFLKDRFSCPCVVCRIVEHWLVVAAHGWYENDDDDVGFWSYID